MKTYKNILLLVGILLLPLFVNSQAIRKNYKEMTPAEKIALRDAFYQSRDMDNDGAGDSDPDDDDLINDLAEFHLNFFSFDNTADPTQLDIHLNLPGEEPREIFFAWHRAMIFELEQFFQDVNPNLAMPYWNTVQPIGYSDNDVITDVNSTLFTADFLGPFDADWQLNRDLADAANSLPTTTHYNNAVNLSSTISAFSTVFFRFSNMVERGPVHSGAHRWVGGTMRSSASARDPVFYLHHTYVDKIWDEWQKNDPSHVSGYLRDDMLRYDGTYTFYGVTKPVIDPDDLIDGKAAYGTFYAENQLALLEDYTVSNTYRPQENFYYQYTIESGNNFIVPATKDCKFESVNEILLTPGFHAENGSDFLAKIDSDADLGTTARSAVESKVGISNPFDENINTQIIVFNEELTSDDVTILKTFPNPFTDKIYINLSNTVEECKIEVINMMGKTIRKEIYKNVLNIELDGLYDMSNGVYVLRVTDTKKDKPLIVKRFIKI